MKKYYYSGKEVNIGDSIRINSELLKADITITEKFIEDNPNLFEVKEDIPEYVECIEEYKSAIGGQYVVGNIYPIVGKYIRQYLDIKVGSCSYKTKFKPSTKEAYEKQELLKEAKKRYPIGTRFKVAHMPEATMEVSSHDNYNSTFVGNNNDLHINFLAKCISQNYTSIESIGGSVYCNGNWAEIIEPVLTTEDGVDIYEGDKYWYVDIDFKCNVPKCTHAEECSGIATRLKYFSTKEAAEKWIEENKPKKTLNDYQSILLGCKIGDFSHFYGLMKASESKLYWQKVLQLIADDLNGDWKPDWNNAKQHKIAIVIDKDDYDVNYFYLFNYGLIIFKDRGIAQKAIEIMGDKLDRIYKK